MDAINKRVNELMEWQGVPRDIALQIAMFEAGKMSNDVIIVNQDGTESPAPLQHPLGGKTQ